MPRAKPDRRKKSLEGDGGAYFETSALCGGWTSIYLTIRVRWQVISRKFLNQRDAVQFSISGRLPDSPQAFFGASGAGNDFPMQRVDSCSSHTAGHLVQGPRAVARQWRPPNTMNLTAGPPATAAISRAGFSAVPRDSGRMRDCAFRVGRRSDDTVLRTKDPSDRRN